MTQGFQRFTKRYVNVLGVLIGLAVVSSILLYSGCGMTSSPKTPASPTPTPTPAPPTSTITSPTEGATVPVGTQVAITGTASSAGGGSVVRVDVSVDGGANYSMATGTTAWSFNWTPSSPGPVTIKSRAVDNLGNMQNPPAEIHVTVKDLTPPTSTITSPTAGVFVNTGITVNITGTASDAGGGSVVKVEVSVDGGDSYSAATGTNAWNFNWKPTTLGLATIKSRAVDNSGNVQDPPTQITVTVRDPITISVPKDQPTIQSAINTAINGDTALVSPGTYNENINFNGKAITVKSESGPQNTIIDGGKLGSVVTFTSGEGRDSILNGFTVQNGSENGSTGVGGGIIIADSSPTITKNVITNNHACLGGGAGIWINFGSPLIQLNTITNNGDDISCPGTGGGIQVNGNSSVKILNKLISNNKVALESFGGGGIDMGPNNDGIPIIKGNVIKGNGSSTVGGGILLASPNAVVVQNLITGNHAEHGGGIFLVPISQRLANNTIVDNGASSGSGIYSSFIDSVPPQPTNNLTELTNNIIVAIQAPQGDSVIYCLNSNSIPSVIRFNNIFSVSGFTFGGAITNPSGMNGNFSTDPLFANPSRGDYHLLSSSFCIDAGYTQAPSLPDKDLDGAPRTVERNGDGNGIIDIGVDEFTGQDRSLPISIITAPTAGATVLSGITVSISGVAFDFGGGTVQSVQVSVDGGATWNVAAGTTDWSYNWAPTTPGPATIMSRAIDNSGNVQDPPWEIMVTTVQDTTPPTSIIASPTAGATVNTGTPVNITGSASDAGGGTVARVEVSVDGGVTWSAATGTTAWSYMWTPAMTGSATISSRAVDDSGNVQELPAQITVTVRDPITIRVTPGQTIQSAIASTINGDTVQVAPGIYVENINFGGKAITVRSESGRPEDTIIDGGKVNPVVMFNSGEGRDSVLNGFTLQNGRADLSNGIMFGEGGGVRIEISSPTITNNVITNNGACDGGGVYIVAGSPLVQMNTITGNSAGTDKCAGGTYGVGIFISGSGSPEILDNVISQNTAFFGGGLGLGLAGSPMNDPKPLIVQNLITGNEGGQGGGIYWRVPVGVSGPILVNNTIADNDSTHGSGIYAEGYSAQAELTNNIIIAKPGQSSFYSIRFAQTPPPPPIIRFNNIFSSGGGMAYEGAIPDMTGTNGNKSLDPLFANPTQGDYHLLQGSPSIDAGYNQAPNLPDNDLDGNQRVLDGNGDRNAIIDMGAYEFLAPASEVWNFLPRSPGSFTTRIPIGVGSPHLLSSISRAKPFNLDWQIIIKGSSL